MSTPSKEALEAVKEFRDNWKACAVDFDANLTNQKLEAAMDQLAKAEAHVKELEATCAELVTDANAVTLAANLAKQSQRAEQAEARVKELQKQEAESRRLFYAEQDKRQSAEFRCEELAGALREIATYDTQRAAVNGCAYAIISIAVNILARHAAGDPEAQK